MNLLVADRLFDGQTFHDDVAVEIVDGIIQRVLPGWAAGEPVGPGLLLTPGFIDVQVNGGGGVLLNDRPDAASLAQIASAHRQFGTTGCLPTLITDRPDKAAALADAVASSGPIPGVLGVHLEGPFLNPERAGVHARDLIRAPGPTDWPVLDRLTAGGAVLVTLAPECVPVDLIRRLVARGIRVAVGHSLATASQVIAAADAGLSGVTHLFNAMPPLAGRAPGVVGAALADARLFAGIICDGHHVDMVSIRVALAAKGVDRMMLVTDAMPTVGSDLDRFDLPGLSVRLVEGRLVGPDGTLAGAHLGMIDAVRFLVGRCGVGLDQALTMASRTPATFLGLGDRLGRIAPGYAADMVALTPDLAVASSWIAGARVDHA